MSHGLTLQDVAATHDARLVLRAVSGSCAPGTVTVLLGPNGSGKSTLLHVLAGVHPLSAGRVQHGPHALVPDRRPPTAWRAAVTLVMHDPDDQLFGATVCEDVSLGPTNLGLPAPQVMERVDDALAALDLEELHEWPPHALSHGQKLRVVLAGLAAMQPQVMLLDEPTSGLDSVAVAHLAALVERWRAAGQVVVVSTHDVEFAWRVADQVVVLERGRVRHWETAVQVLGSVEACHRLAITPPAVVAAHGALRLCGVPLDAAPPRLLSDLLADAERRA